MEKTELEIEKCNSKESKKKNALVIVTLILGCASAFVPIFSTSVGIMLAVVAIVLAIVCRKKTGRFEAMSIAGLCTGVYGLLLSLVIGALKLIVIVISLLEFLMPSLTY